MPLGAPDVLGRLAALVADTSAHRAEAAGVRDRAASAVARSRAACHASRLANAHAADALTERIAARWSLRRAARRGAVRETRDVRDTWDSRARGPRREVRDARGDVWTLHEMDARHVPGARADRCLVIGNDAAVRRLWRYPPDWATLPEPALRALIELPGV